MALAALLAACAPKTPTPSAGRGDAAAALAADEAIVGALAAAPVFGAGAVLTSFGGADADSLHDPTLMRSVHFVAADRFVTLDPRERRLTVFDLGGRVIATHGRRGEGPKEFRFVSSLFLAADSSVYAIDQPGRLVHLSPALTFLGDGRIGPTSGASIRWVLLDSDTTGLALVEREPEYQTVSTPRRRTTGTLVRISPTKVDTVSTWDDEWTSPVQGSSGGIEPGSVELGPSLQYAAFSGQLAIGNGDRWEIAVLNGRGLPRSTIRLDMPLRSVTEAMRAAVRKSTQRSILESPGASRAAALRRVNQLPFVDTLPAYTSLMGSLDGSLWVGVTLAPTDSVRHYAVFDRDGQLQQRVSLHHSRRVIAANHDVVVARWVDPDGLAHLDVIRLARMR